MQTGGFFCEVIYDSASVDLVFKALDKELKINNYVERVL